MPTFLENYCHCRYSPARATLGDPKPISNDWSHKHDFLRHWTHALGEETSVPFASWDTEAALSSLALYKQSSLGAASFSSGLLGWWWSGHCMAHSKCFFTPFPLCFSWCPFPFRQSTVFASGNLFIFFYRPFWLAVAHLSGLGTSKIEIRLLNVVRNKSKCVPRQRPAFA